MKTLVLGGVRSGKSRFAEDLARKGGLPVTYIATATACDEEMSKRIAAHQARRPRDWTTIEEPLALVDALAREAQAERLIVVECLTLWLGNILLATNEREVALECGRLADMLVDLPGDLIFVSNETGSGVIPVGELTRSYCDQIGLLHQRIAEGSEQVFFLVAGIPLPLKQPRPGIGVVLPKEPSVGY